MSGQSLAMDVFHPWHSMAVHGRWGQFSIYLFFFFKKEEWTVIGHGFIGKTFFRKKVTEQNFSFFFVKKIFS